MEKKKPIMKEILRLIIICTTSILIGAIALLLVYKIPLFRMKKNLNESINVFQKEGAYPQIINGYNTTMLDNFTDALILGEAIYEGEEKTKDKAMYIYRMTKESPELDLINQLSGKTQNFKRGSYSRYWHGIVVPIKILLLFFEYSDIRLINCFFQIILCSILLYLMIKKNLSRYIFPFIISLLFISPFIIGLSIQFSTVFYISILSSIILLIYNDRLNSRQFFPYFFLFIGIFVSYFDLLTFPLLSLTLPLSFYFLLNKKNNLNETLKSMFFNILFWLIGYTIMWMGKWLIGSLLCHDNFFEAAFQSAKYRTQSDIGRFYAIIKNISVYKKAPYIVLFSITTFYYIVKFIKNRIKLQKKICLKLFPFFIIMIMPLCWYFVLSSHSILHFWFTHRALMTSFFSYFIILTIITSHDKEMEEK